MYTNIRLMTVIDVFAWHVTPAFTEDKCSWGWCNACMSSCVADYDNNPHDLCLNIIIINVNMILQT